MNKEDLKVLAQDIVKKSCALKDKYTSERNAPVNYACIFCHSMEEYDLLRKLAREFGTVLQETHSGPLYHIQPLKTVSGDLKILKIRLPDDKHMDLGDADFSVEDYPSFKQTYLPKPRFKLIERPNMEMIELMDSSFDVRAYFSHPPLDQQFGIS